MNEMFVNMLECPRTKRALSFQDGKLTNGTYGDKGFPIVDGVPWVFRYPESQLSQWKVKVQQVLNRLQSKSSEMKNAIASDAELSENTKVRLKNLQTAYEHNLSVYQKILSGFTDSVDQSIDLSLGDKIHSKQNLESYYDNIFRDWSWSTDENQKALDILSQFLSKSNPENNLVVLGSGAGRLGLDLHNKLRPKFTVLVDINPAMMLMGKRVWTGENIEFYEFPLNPIQLSHVAVKNLLQSPYKATEHIYGLFSDVSNLPFKSKSVDVIVTPWLIDIISDDFGDFAKRMNRVLKINSSWVNFGPLGFARSQESKNYSQEEILEILAESGFEVESQSIEKIPYLCSPYSGHGRIEKVFSFSAKKVKDVKEPKSFESSPAWVRDLNLSIPFDSKVQELQSTHRIHAEVLAVIDGKRSGLEISKMMAQHYGMSEAQAQEALTAFLQRLHETNI